MITSEHRERYTKIKKIINLYNKTEWYYEKDFLKPFVRRGNITCHVQTVLEECILPILEEIFKDRYHLRLEIDSMNNGNWILNKIDIIIHYPTVTVTDDDNESTLLTNHFQKLTINSQSNNGSNNLLNCSLLGLTTNPTHSQYLRGYIHSHISNTNFKTEEFKSYCLGDDSVEFKQLRNLINSASGLDYEDWYMFFLNLITIAQTESGAGVPYIKLSNISFGGRIQSTHTVNRISTYIQLYKEFPNKTPVSWTINNGKLSVIDDDKLEKHCLIFENKDSYPCSTQLCMKDSSGNYYGNGNHNSLIPDDITWSYEGFKDKEFKFEILNYNCSQSDKFYIHPKIKKYVSTILEQRANENVIKESIINS